MSDYPMLISNKLHSFRNFLSTKLQFLLQNCYIYKFILKNVTWMKCVTLMLSYLNL